MTDFFKHGNKAYIENLNDGILVGNSFDWTVNISLPGDTGGVFPNSSTVVKAKVADVSATPNSNLSIGETITNNAGSSQVYRLTVYPSFNRYGGFTSVSLVGDGDVIITEVGASAPIRNNLDYSNLGDVVELKQLKEYDIVVTIPPGGVVTGLSFGFKSSSADVTASISQSNVAGLDDRFTSLETSITDNYNALDTAKVDKVAGKQLSTNDFDNTYKSYVEAYTDCNEEHITYYDNMKYTDGVANNPLVIEKVGRVFHLHGTWKTSSSISIVPQASTVLGTFRSPAPNYPIYSSQVIRTGGSYGIKVDTGRKIEVINFSNSSNLTIPANTVCYVNVMWILDW